MVLRVHHEDNPGKTLKRVATDPIRVAHFSSLVLHAIIAQLPRSLARHPSAASGIGARAFRRINV